MAVHGIRSIPTDQLAAIAFEAFQNGMTATHDACIRESLRRSLAAYPDVDAARASRIPDRRGPNRPFSQVAA